MTDICAELSVLATDNAIASWDDAKRRDFIALFKKRSLVGCKVMTQGGIAVIEICMSNFPKMNGRGLGVKASPMTSIRSFMVR